MRNRERERKRYRKSGREEEIEREIGAEIEIPSLTAFEHSEDPVSERNPPYRGFQKGSRKSCR